MVKKVSMRELEAQLAANKELNIIDVREQYEYEDGHIKGSVNIPLSRFDLNKLDNNKEYYIVCFSGGRSSAAAAALSNEGYNVIDVVGGMLAYSGKVVK